MSANKNSSGGGNGNNNEQEQLTFEQALDKLEYFTDLLSSDGTGLEDAIRAYDEGVKYYEICSKILKEAKQKIELFDQRTIGADDAE